MKTQPMFDPSTQSDDQLWALDGRYAQLADKQTITEAQVGRWMGVQAELSARCRKVA